MPESFTGAFRLKGKAVENNRRPESRLKGSGVQRNRELDMQIPDTLEGLAAMSISEELSHSSEDISLSDKSEVGSSTRSSSKEAKFPSVDELLDLSRL